MNTSQFRIKSGRALIADPCLPAGHYITAAKGIWEANVVYEAIRRSMFGRIIAGVEIAVQGIDKYPDRLDIDKRFVVSDSGLVGVFDQVSFVQPGTTNHDSFITQCSKATSKKGWNSLDNEGGVVVQAGNGEGIYLATTFTNQSGELVRVSIDFLDQYDEGFFLETFEN